MSLGGLLYDPSWLNRLLPERYSVPLDVAHRLPVALVFLQGVVCLVIALRFEETAPHKEHAVGRTRAALRLTFQTATRAFTTRGIAVVLSGGLMIDSIVRNFATLGSQYYRLICIPDWALGFIGSLIAVGNWFVPSVAARVNRRFTTTTSLALGGCVVAVALLLLAPAWPWFGLLPAAVLMMIMGFLGFTISRFLHGVAESHERATLLSVKGLVFNLGYGLYSFAFSLLLASLSKHGEAAFQHALYLQVGWFVVALLAFVVVSCKSNAATAENPR
jgi:hypothetical protein